MLDKEAFCLVAQAIYNDLLLSLAGQRHLEDTLCSPLSLRTRSFLSVAFHYHDDLKVVSEDEMGILQSALAGTQSISVVLFQVQKHFQKNVLELYQDADKLSYVCLFNECFSNATSVDLVTAVCSSLRRHLSHAHCISKYQEFVHSPDGNKKKVAKSIYLSFFIPSLQLEALRSYSPAWNTLKHGYATAQFSPQKFMKRSSPFLKSFGFVHIQMRSQSKLHLGLLTEVAYLSAFRRQRQITAPAV